jgi:branched-chain amino acid transport system ATP-binding protein
VRERDVSRLPLVRNDKLMTEQSVARLVETDGVTKRFGGLVAVNAVSVYASEGEIFGLIGPNGAGKTTLFNLLAGSMPPDGGRILFNGRDVTKTSAAEMCELGLTRTFQNPRPFRTLSTLRNAMVGGITRGQSVKTAERLATQALKDVGLWHRRDDRADVLPLGQQKRLEIARCLATEPKVLLLDEITAGLSPGEVGDLVTFIRGLPARGITLIMIEHNMGVALTVCQRLAVLNFGHVIAEGDGKTIASHPEVIAAYLGEPDDEEAAQSDA